MINNRAILELSDEVFNWIIGFQKTIVILLTLSYSNVRPISNIIYVKCQLILGEGIKNYYYII